MFESGIKCVSFEALPQAASPAWLPNPPSRCYVSNLPYFFPLSPIPATFQKVDVVFYLHLQTCSLLLTPTVDFFFLALRCFAACAILLLILVDGK